MAIDFEEEEEGSDEPSAPAWMVTFGDMMSILLTFFVMMLSFSEIDQIKFKGIVGSIKEALGVQNIEYFVQNPSGPVLDIPRGTIDSILNELSSIIPNSFPGASVSKRDGEGGLLVIPGNLLFDSGKAEVRPEMYPLLRRIAQLMKTRPNVILQVEGHTDSVPIYTVRFHDNWDLSTARAASVVRYLIEQCDVAPRQLAAAGYADSRPLVPNDTPEHRERNRRVEFLFVDRSGLKKQVEPGPAPYSGPQKQNSTGERQVR